MWRMGLFAGLVGAALVGCSSYEREYGAGPETKGGASVNVYPDNYRAEILAYQRTYLNDPSGIRSAAISQPAIRKIGNIDRYAVCVRFNGKGASGAYTGVRDHLAIFLAGKLDQMGPTAEQCKTATYEPFPDLERLRR
jgi:hypothetical protein